MSQKRENVHNFLNHLRKDFAYRTFVFSGLSFCATVLFAGYNLFLGIAYGAAWNICICVYFVCLALLRAYVIVSERRASAVKDGEGEKRRARAFFVQSVSLFAVDLALVAPISLMVMQDRTVEYSAIPAITVAAYTTYRIVLSARNFFKARSQGNAGVKMLRNINLMDALVSVLSLQYTLVMTFGDGVDGEMLPLCAVSSFAVWAFLVGFSVRIVWVALRELRAVRRA